MATARHQTKPTDTCPYCASPQIIRKGKRKNKYGAVQLFFCKDCRRKFTPLVTKHRTFPLRVILDALTLYSRLHGVTEAAHRVGKHYGITVHPQNITNWLRDFKEHLPILRLRSHIAERYAPRRIILESQLFHGQIYDFKYHRAKTDLLLEQDSRHDHFRPLQTFLERVPKNCPHELFRNNPSRASQSKQRFNLDQVTITPKANAAVAIARLVLQAVSNNKRRHETLQAFMLANDSATVAVEVPIVLTAADIAHYQHALGFQIPLTLAKDAAITGHIDILQIRNGRIHILDYKPDAKKTKPIEQLMIYALALSRITGIRLYHFTCAWFDDSDYYEFFPLHVAHKKQPLRRP